MERLKASAAEQQRPQPALMPRMALRLTQAHLTDDTLVAGHGTIDQIAGVLGQLRSLGADTVVLDPFNGTIPRRRIRKRRGRLWRRWPSAGPR